MMWDFIGDEFSPIDEDHEILEVAILLLDEPRLKSVLFVNERDKMVKKEMKLIFR